MGVVSSVTVHWTGHTTRCECTVVLCVWACCVSCLCVSGVCVCVCVCVFSFLCWCVVYERECRVLSASERCECVCVWRGPRCGHCGTHRTQVFIHSPQCARVCPERNVRPPCHTRPGGETRHRHLRGSLYGGGPVETPKVAVSTRCSLKIRGAAVKPLRLSVAQYDENGCTI